MKKFSFIFAGTSEISIKVLELLLTNPLLDLKAVLTQPNSLQGRGLKNKNSPVKRFALIKKIPVLEPLDCSTDSFLKTVLEQKADFCFVCAYGQILPLKYLKIFPKNCLNLHFSLLPRLRGAAPIQRALMFGDQQTDL